MASDVYVWKDELLTLAACSVLIKVIIKICFFLDTDPLHGRLCLNARVEDKRFFKKCFSWCLHVTFGVSLSECKTRKTAE